MNFTDHLQALIATMREMSSLAAENAESLDAFCLHQSGRFDVLARVHAVMLRDGGGAVDLGTLVWDELSAVISPSEEERISIAGPAVSLDGRAAELLALAIHELTTNAIKFGALAEEVGLVEVIWKRVSGPIPHLHLAWTESDADVPVRLPIRRGFGRELVETILPRRLDAETRFSLTASGLRCEIELPLAAAALASPGEMAAAA